MVLLIFKIFEAQHEGHASLTNVALPCRGFPCSIEAKGTFLSDLSIINMGFELEAHLASGGTSKLMAVEENFCEWMELKQGGVVQCPPRKGDASITYDLVLGRGWVMPVSLPSSPKERGFRGKINCSL